MRAYFAIFVVLALDGCRCRTEETDETDETDESQPPSDPPLAPVDVTLPHEAVDALPTTRGGDPALSLTPAVGLPGMEIAITYDPDLDDPITRWAGCLSRLAACARTNPPGSRAGCIDRLEVCDDPAGGSQCCPQSCMDAFRVRYAATGDEDQAVAEAFWDGSCVDGFDAMFTGRR